MSERLSELIDITRDDYTTTEVAELVGLSDAYLRRLLGEREQLRGRNVGGRVWLIEGRSLKEWLEARERRLSGDK